MKINDAYNSLVKIYTLSQKDTNFRAAPMLWGPPGVGKSTIVARLAAQVNLPLVDLRLSTMSPVDLRGLPRIDENGQTVFTRPEFILNRPFVLFLDEVTTAPAALQVAAYEIALDRRVGGYPLPAGTFVVLAGNRQADAGAYGAYSSMPLPLANRLIHLDIEVSVEDFVTYLAALDLPAGPTVAAFLSFRPDLLLAVPAGTARDGAGLAFPTPRAWETVARLPDEATELAGCVVGVGAASEFLAFRKLQDELPDVSAILQGAAEPFVPQRLDIGYSYAAALAAAVKPEQISNLVKALEPLEPTLQALVFHLVKGNKDIVQALVRNSKFRAIVNKIGAMFHE